MDQFSSIISVFDPYPTGSLFVDQVDHDLFVKNSRVHRLPGVRTVRVPEKQSPLVPEALA